MDFDIGPLEPFIKWAPYSSDWFIFPFGIITNLLIPVVIGTWGLSYLLRFIFLRAPVLRKISGISWIIAAGMAFMGAAHPFIRPFLVYGGAIMIAYFKFGKMPKRWLWIIIALVFLGLIFALYWVVIPLLENMTRGMF